MLSMPFGARLKQARHLHQLVLGKRSTYKLQAYGRPLVAKAAGHAKGGESAEIADAADGVRKAKSIVKVGVQRCGSDRKRCSNQNVCLDEDSIHPLFKQAADTLRQDEIRGTDLFIHVAADLSQRII